VIEPFQPLEHARLPLRGRNGKTAVHGVGAGFAWETIVPRSGS